MGESKEKLITAVKHYQDSLERHTKTGNVEKLLHAIEKLARLPIKVCHLEETGVGRTVNGLKKFEGSVGDNARGLVDKWKNMVKGEEEEEERARLEKEQEMQEDEEEEEEIDTSHEDTLHIVEPEEDTVKDVKVIIDSSHRQSSSSNKQSHSSKHSSRHKKSKRNHSGNDSDSSESNHQSKRHKSSKNYTKDSDSDSESSDSSRERSSQNKHKSRKSSSESGDDSGSDSQGYSSSDRVSAKPKSKSTKESKDRKYKKSSSDSDRDKSRDRHYSSKDKSRDHSKSKSEKESSLKKESSSKSRSESKHEKDKKSSSRSEDKKKESSRSHRENGKTSEDKRRHREYSADKEVKRKKNELDNRDSSSSKNRDKDNKKSEDSSRKDKGRENSSKKSSKDKPKSSGSKMVDLDCIDSGSGTSFAAALGMLAPVTSKPKKKIVEISQSTKSSSSNGTSSKTSNSKESSSKHSSSKESSKSSSSKESSKSSSSKKSSKSSSSRSSSVGSSPSKSHYKTSEVTNSKNVGVEEVDLFKTPTNLEPLPQNIDISNLLPQITPHYKPLGVSLDGFRRNLTDDEALSKVITAKHQRTKVYSGNKANYTKVPSLFDICCRILQDNIDALEYTGGVPYTILKPILEKANPDQLYQLEFHNPYLIEDTDELWQLHCQKEFRNKKKEEMESGREMYLRCLDEREAKLKALTANIKQSQDKSVPVRQTKLAYIDSVVKPPRNIARKQARNGTILDIQRPAQTTQERLSQIAKAGEAGKVVVPKPGRPVSEKSSSSQLKPKKAPLMAKTLSLLKNRFGRR